MGNICEWVSRQTGLCVYFTDKKVINGPECLAQGAQMLAHSSLYGPFNSTVPQVSIQSIRSWFVTSCPERVPRSGLLGPGPLFSIPKFQENYEKDILKP